MTETIDDLPLAQIEPDWAESAKLLEQTIKAGLSDPNALYLLALSYKRLNRIADARQILSKIADPDALVLIQRGVLAFIDKDFAQASEMFERAWTFDSTSYAAGYNLLLTRLCQGQSTACLDLLARVVPLGSPTEQRFLGVLRSLLTQNDAQAGSERDYLLDSLNAEEESRLIDLITGLSPFEIVYKLLSQLVQARPTSPTAFRAYVSAALVQGKGLMDRCQWTEATGLLAPLKRRLDSIETPIEIPMLLAITNMLGTCACMEQDFERGVVYHRQALETFSRDFSSQRDSDRMRRYVNTQGVFLGAWLEQNMALNYEWMGRLDQAEKHWNRYFDGLEQQFSRSLPPDFLPTLAFEGMSRLADLFSRKERWSSAVHFLQRAHRVKPTDYETMERLFQLYTQLKRSDDARKLLKKMRDSKPNDPQAEVFELEVREARKIEEIDELLSDVKRLQQRYPNDKNVEERIGTLANNLVPTLERIADQYANQVNKVVDQMRRLPSYQINWTMVREVMREMEDKYVILRRSAQKCLGRVTQEDARRDLNRLVTHCERKIDQCHSLGE